MFLHLAQGGNSYNTSDLSSMYPKTANGQLGIMGIINRFEVCF